MEWGVQNGLITKNPVFPISTLFFWAFCFRIRTFYKELIWSTNYPNAHIHTSQKCWSFIWECFFLSVSLKLILLQPLGTISICHVLWEQFYCSCLYIKTARNNSQLFKETTWVVKLLRCWSAWVQWYVDLIFSALLTYSSVLLIHFLQ